MEGEQWENYTILEDIWHQDISLKNWKPRLYSITRWEHFSIKDFVAAWHTHPTDKWSRNLRVWEDELEEQLSILINCLSLQPERI